MRAPVVLLLLLAASPAAAGDRELEVLLVNLTPDALSTAPSKKCVRDLEARLEADHTRVTRIGETELRKLARKTAGEPFLDWPADALKPAKQRGTTWIDAAVLVDCRPEARRLDVLVAPASPGRARFELRATVDDAALSWLGEAVLRRAWSGFSP